MGEQALTEAAWALLTLGCKDRLVLE